jgi:uncharacterized protein (TIGR03790 family)
MKACGISCGSIAAWLAWLLVLAPLVVRAGGDEVVVVYNSRMPESKMVAYHYAAMRKVPAAQIFGFEMTTNEIISREDFTEQLQKPLADKLEAGKLWRFGMVTFPATNGQPAVREERVVTSRIRYAALCYGVPLKIAPSSLIEEMAIKITKDELRRNEAAVDSELAWLPLIKTEVSLTGPIANPFYAVTNHATLNCMNGILLVSRLDGPTAEIANELVDKAMEAESNGLWGRAYVDARGLAKTNSYFEGDQWMMTSAEVCRLAGFDVQTDTNAATFPATFPMSQIAIYAGWYASVADGPFLAPKMEFMPGAFAYHLYSYSADRLRGDLTVNWCGALLAKGATCTMGCVYEPYMQFTPNVAFFLFAWLNDYSFGEAAWASQRALSWQTTVIGDPLYQPAKVSPQELYSRLFREKSPLVEWLFERAANLNLIRGARLEQAANFIEGLPVTRQSAVLTEKLADLYERQGKPASAIETWERALKLNPSPQQRIRLRLGLAQKLLAAHREAEAADNWRQFIAEAPGYPGIGNIREALRDLEQKIDAQKK